MGFWDKVKTFFGSLGEKLSRFFASDAGKVMKKSLANIIETTAPVVVDVIFSMAVKEVKRVDLIGELKGAQKSDEVKRILMGFVKAKGLDIAENTVDLAIKAAVGALREDQRTSTPST